MPDKIVRTPYELFLAKPAYINKGLIGVENSPLEICS